MQEVRPSILWPLVGALLGALLAGAAGCDSVRSPTPASFSRPSHTAGEPVTSRGSWQWLPILEDEFLRVVNAVGFSRTAPSLPGDDLRSLRLASALARVDGAMRETFAGHLDEVPPPRGRVYVSAGVNGFVSAGWVCYDFADPTAATTAASTAAADSNAGSKLLAVRDETTAIPLDSKACAKGTDLAGLDAFFSWLERRAPGCRIARDARGVLFTGECPSSWRTEAAAAAVLEADPKAPHGSNAWRATRVAHVTTFAAVSVSTAALERLPEDEFEALIAHELAHYYRAHATAAHDEYDYFYRVGEGNSELKPLPDASLASLGAKLLSLGSMLDHPRPSPGVRHPALVGFTNGLAGVVREQESPSPACSEFVATLDAGTALVWPYVTGADTSEAAARAWAQVDASLSACAETLVVSADRLADLLPYSMKDLATSDPEAWATTPLPTILTRIDARHWEQVATFERAVEERLGYYTVEQEADDMSAEILTTLGRDSGAAAALLLSQFRARADASGRDSTLLTEMGLATCEAHRARGWRDERGQPVFVPIADFNGAHHALCFRIHNLDREVEAHRWGRRLPGFH